MFKSDVIPWLIEPVNDLVNRLDALVENVLIPESQVDSASPLPKSHLDQLVDNGLVTIVTGPESLWNAKTKFAITEQIAYGCLDTWFVITQHWGAASIIQRANASPDVFWDSHSLLGVGFGHLRRSTPCLRAEHRGTDLYVNGIAPWITGASWLSWVVYGATLPNGDHVYFRLRHIESDGYAIGKPQALAAVRRTDTREVVLNLNVPSDLILCVRPPGELSSQDEATLVTSMSPILGLTARCLVDWSREVKPDNRATFEYLTRVYHHLRGEVYGILGELGAVSVPDRLRVREKLHLLLETIVHIWSLSSGGQSNTSGMMVIRRRQEAAFFRVFQQTKALRNTAIDSALGHLNNQSWDSASLTRHTEPEKSSVT